MRQLLYNVDRESMTEANTQVGKPKIPRSLIIVGLVIIAIGCVGLLLPALRTAVWVGRTDLEVQFLVTDSSTGLPVPQATVHIRDEERRRGSLTLTTDQQGFAKKLLKDCTSTGRQGPFEDTYYVYLPSWSFHVSAGGYTQSEDTILPRPEFARAVKRGPPFATVLVPIQIKKSE